MMVPANTCSATKALEHQEHKISVSQGNCRQTSIDSKLANDFFRLHFEEEDVNAFPVIEWEESSEDSDSISDDSSYVRSMDSWNVLLTDFDCSTSMRKRGRCKNSLSRRLVRSKKIKSDLASLAAGF